MLVSEAKQELNQFDDDEHIGMMLVCADEVKEICGSAYRNTDAILDLLSRRSDRNCWYDKRHIFPELIQEAYGVVERRKEDDRRTKSNNALANELELEILRISVNHEVRPMMIISVNEVTVETLGMGEFTLPAGSTYGDLLIILDKKLLETGDRHVYYEGIQMNHNNDRMHVIFGS